MDFEIPRHLVNYEEGKTLIVIRHAFDTPFGKQTREDTLVLDRIEDWTRDSITAAAQSALAEAAAQKVAPKEMDGSLKISVPLELVK